MTNPQQPELRRSETGKTVEGVPGPTSDDATAPDAGHAHGTDKGNKGGGRGGGVPPAQQGPPH